MSTGRPPALLPPPAALVVDGRHQIGGYDAPIPIINPLDVVATAGLRARVGRLVRHLRIKEWEAVQFGDDEWFVLAAAYDAKVIGMLMVIAVHQPTGRIHRWVDQVPSTAVAVARGLQGTASDVRTRRGRLTFTNEIARGRLGIAAHHRGAAGLPPMRLSGDGTCPPDAVRHVAVCLPFDDAHVLYTNKCLMPFAGELVIGDEVVRFAADRSFLILDDHHGEYPLPQDYDWITGARRQPDGSVLGFNLTANQVLRPEVHNENVVWVDGDVHRLPPVTFARPDGVDGPWHVTAEGAAVDVTFTPEVRSTRHVGPRHLIAEYHAPYGRFAGRVAVPDGPTVVVDGLFGMGERKHIRA